MLLYLNELVNYWNLGVFLGFEYLFLSRYVLIKKKKVVFLKKKMIIKGILYFLNEVIEGSNILEDSGWNWW